MKTTQRILGLMAALLINNPGLFAQTSSTATATGAGTTSGSGTSTGTPSSTGTTNGTGTTTGTGTTSGGGTATGSGTAPTTPARVGPPATNPGNGKAIPANEHATTTTPPSGSSTMPATTAKPDQGKASPHTVNEHASDNAKAVQAVLQKFDASRDQFMAERKVLIEKLNAAKTEVERKAILEQLRADHADQRALGKEIRDELKKVREQRQSGG